MEKINGEQPIVQDHGAEAQVIEKSNLNEFNGGLNETFGSPYGKFKDAKSLLEAYNNLQKEFTRKSQALSKVLKDGAGVDANGIKSKTNDSLLMVRGEGNNGNQPSGSAEKDNLPSEEGNASQINNDRAVSENGNEFIYKSPTWKGLVVDFFRANPEAKSYVKDMSEMILKNPSIAKSEDCLNLAYKLSLAKSFKEPAQLSQDDDFLKKYIVGNSRAEELIIGNYINSLKNRSTPPEVMSGMPAAMAITPPKKYSTLKEAGDILKGMFK